MKPDVDHDLLLCKGNNFKWSYYIPEKSTKPVPGRQKREQTKDFCEAAHHGQTYSLQRPVGKGWDLSVLPPSQRPTRGFSRQVTRRSGRPEKAPLCSEARREEDSRQRGRQCAPEPTVFTPASGTRARVVATTANRPQLWDVLRGCFLKMAVDLRYSLPKAGVDVASQRLGKLVVEESTERG